MFISIKRLHTKKGSASKDHSRLNTLFEEESKLAIGTTNLSTLLDGLSPSLAGGLRLGTRTVHPLQYTLVSPSQIRHNHPVVFCGGNLGSLGTTREIPR